MCFKDTNSLITKRLCFVSYTPSLKSILNEINTNKTKQKNKKEYPAFLFFFGKIFEFAVPEYNEWGRRQKRKVIQKHAEPIRSKRRYTLSPIDRFTDSVAISTIRKQGISDLPLPHLLHRVVAITPRLSAPDEFESRRPL